MAVENENTIMGMIESEIGGSPICESVKQIADVLFESNIDDYDDDVNVENAADDELLAQNATDEEDKQLDQWLRKKEPVRVPKKAWNKY